MTKQHTPEFEAFCDEHGYDYTSPCPEDQQEVKAAWTAWQAARATPADQEPVYLGRIETSEGNEAWVELSDSDRRYWRDTVRTVYLAAPQPTADHSGGKPAAKGVLSEREMDALRQKGLDDHLQRLERKDGWKGNPDIDEKCCRQKPCVRPGKGPCDMPAPIAPQPADHIGGITDMVDAQCKPGGCAAIGCEGGHYCFNADGSAKIPEEFTNANELAESMKTWTPVFQADDAQGVRDAVIEECAKECDRVANQAAKHLLVQQQDCASSLAGNIRALKSAPPQKPVSEVKP